jgi:hypothetical protein
MGWTIPEALFTMEFREEARLQLSEIGLSSEQLERISSGREVAFDFPVEIPIGVALIQVTPDLLRCGILEINYPGGGLSALLQFRNRSFELARSIGLERVELFGMAVTNSTLRDVLLRKSFVARMVPCPEDLGGGSEQVEVLAREFIVP